MKKETKNKIFKILEPVVEFLKENGVDAKPAIFRSYYGAIKVDNNYSNEVETKFRNFVENKDDCGIFMEDEWLGGKYIIFSFTIDGKWSHAWE